MSILSTCPGDADASFDNMPDDIVSAVLGAVAVFARSPSDFLPATMVSKRFLELGMNIVGTNMAGARCFAVRAKYWCSGARRFLQRCAQAGNLDASYILGMILFYCLNSHDDGVEKISFAASNGHPEAMYSLAVIMFNGSGGGEAQRDIPSAAAMCAREASLGHVIAPPLAMLLPKKRLLLLSGEDARAAGRLGTTIPHVVGNQLTWLRFDLGQRTTVQTIFPTFRVRSR